jgi:hypothetical protein
MASCFLYNSCQLPSIYISSWYLFFIGCIWFYLLFYIPSICRKQIICTELNITYHWYELMCLYAAAFIIISSIMNYPMTVK